MPSIIGLELNKPILSITNASEYCFSAIKIPKQNSPVKIKSITWNCLINNAADRAAYNGQYVAILRNASIEESLPSIVVGTLAIAPIFNTNTAPADLVWVDAANGLSSHNHANFSDGLLLEAGNDYLIFLPPPSITGAVTGTIYSILSVNAESIGVKSNPSTWVLS